MIEIRNTAPETIEEYNEMIDALVSNSKEAFDTEKERQENEILEQWDREYPDMRKERIAQAIHEIDVNIEAQALSRAEGDSILNRKITEIDKSLEEEKKQRLDGIFIEPPQNRESFEATYGFMRDAILSKENDMALPENPPVDQAVYKLGNGQYYSVPLAKFISATSVAALPPDGTNNVIEINDSPEEFKTGVLEFYKANGYPHIKIGSELLTLEELKAQAIAETNQMVQEEIVSGFDYPIENMNLHFSFKDEDQRNFAMMANACSVMPADSEEENIQWQAWTKDENPVFVDIMMNTREFMDLYINGAMKHLNNWIGLGRKYKHDILSANSKSAVIEVTNVINNQE